MVLLEGARGKNCLQLPPWHFKAESDITHAKKKKSYNCPHSGVHTVMMTLWNPDKINSKRFYISTWGSSFICALDIIHFCCFNHFAPSGLWIILEYHLLNSSHSTKKNLPWFYFPLNFSAVCHLLMATFLKKTFTQLYPYPKIVLTSANMPNWAFIPITPENSLFSIPWDAATLLNKMGSFQSLLPPSFPASLLSFLPSIGVKHNTKLNCLRILASWSNGLLPSLALILNTFLIRRLYYFKWQKHTWQ